MENQKKALISNTIMLYGLTFSSYFMSFIVVPYETRVLGPMSFGLLGVTSAVMVYFQLIIDFGFLLSATEEVSRNRHDRVELSKILTSVTINKLFLSLISGIILITICMLIRPWRENFLFFILSYFVTILVALMPDFMYRGLEKMATITIRAILIRAFFTIMVIIFVKSSNDVIYIPILNIIGNLLALIFVYSHLIKKMEIRFVHCSKDEILIRLKTSSMFFISRIATTMYTAANTIILDLISVGTMTAFYSSANQIISTAKNGMTPISDSLYPYMIKYKDIKIVYKILLVFEPIIIIGCIIIFIFAEPLCVWFFGIDYIASAPILRALIPIIAIILPSYIFGFPVLGAMKLSKYANYSVIFGSIIHIVNLVILYTTGNLNMISLGIATTLAEALILCFRLVVYFKNKNYFFNKLESFL